jgi:hypothetical protein
MVARRVFHRLAMEAIGDWVPIVATSCGAFGIAARSVDGRSGGSRANVGWCS